MIFRAFLLSSLLSAAAFADPILDLPPEPSPQPLAPYKPTDSTVGTNRSYSMDLGAGRRIPVGSYGEAQVVSQGHDTKASLRRVVLFFGHQFLDWLAVYAELEVENVNDFEIEQTYIELKPFKHLRLGGRVGLLLIPMGIINLYHEPPTFNGVDRPTVDQLIIPTTWRELGAGLFGTISDGLLWELDVVLGPDGSGFSPSLGIFPGTSLAGNVKAQNAAVAGRVHFNRVLGLDLGASFYYGSANNKDAQYRAPNNLTYSVTGTGVGIIEADGRFSRWGLSLRSEYARVFIKGADTVTNYLRSQTPGEVALGSQMQGFYFEAGYDLLHPLKRTRHEVIAFGRYEHVDLHAGWPNVADPRGVEASQYLTLGLTYRPIPEVAFKFDYRRTLAGPTQNLPPNDPAPANDGRDRYSVGISYMY